MREAFEVLTSNDLINLAFIAWFSAQLIKTALSFWENKYFDAERLIGSGGMPSSHSSLVCALAVGVARQTGYDSAEFALSLVLAGIVMYDAMGVRRAAGEQAKVINKMMIDFDSVWNALLHPKEQSNQDGEENDVVKELKEFLGHTPIEVLGGAILGIIIGMVMPV